jgi:hypothetical protein
VDNCVPTAGLESRLRASVPSVDSASRTSPEAGSNVTHPQPYPTPLDLLLARVRATDEEARRILGYSPAPQEMPPVEEPASSTPVVAGDMPAWEAVELQMNIGEDIITFVGRDLASGRPRIKVEMSTADATAEWVPWLRRWLERKRRGSLHLVD